MDRYGTIGPARGDYASDVDHIAKLLRDGMTVYVEHCALGSRHRLLMVCTGQPNFIAYCNSQEAIDAGGDRTHRYDKEEWLFVGINTEGGAWGGLYPFGSAPAPSYLAEKLGLRYGGDADTLARFIGDIWEAM
jgi:hypothetical protein